MPISPTLHGAGRRHAGASQSPTLPIRSARQNQPSPPAAVPRRADAPGAIHAQKRRRARAAASIGIGAGGSGPGGELPINQLPVVDTDA